MPDFSDPQNPSEVVALMDRVIAVKPAEADAHILRGNALIQLGRFPEAIFSYDKAIALRPDRTDAWLNRGVALKKIGRLADAVASYDQAIAIAPDSALGHSNRGNALIELNRPDEALVSLDKAIALKPDYAEAWLNRGVALKKLHNIDQAIASYDRAIALKPDYAEAYSNRGAALTALQRLDDALASYDSAIAIKPDYTEAHCNKSLTLLLKGEFEAGWLLHEWRFRLPLPAVDLSQFSTPLWLGEELLEDKTILLHAERGLGDIIQFCRYATLVSELGATVLLEVPKPLVTLLQGLKGVTDVIEEGRPRPPFDYHCPLMSLPLAFKTRVSTIPYPTAYLCADPAKAQAWRGRLGDGKKLKVGLAWSGGLEMEKGGNNQRRNIPLDLLSRELNGVDAEFCSLQKGEQPEAEIRARQQDYWPHGNFHNFTAELADFSDTAALIDNLDLVVTVDTSVAHLAGALGKPVWMLNRFDTCWRWLLGRNDSPWYQSMKLYWQAEGQSWDSVLPRVTADLIYLVGRRG